MKRKSLISFQLKRQLESFDLAAQTTRLRQGQDGTTVQRAASASGKLKRQQQSDDNRFVPAHWKLMITSYVSTSSQRMVQSNTYCKLFVMEILTSNKKLKWILSPALTWKCISYILIIQVIVTRIKQAVRTTSTSNFIWTALQGRAPLGGHLIPGYMWDLMKLIRPFVELSWDETGPRDSSSGWIFLASCLPSSTLESNKGTNWNVSHTGKKYKAPQPILLESCCPSHSGEVGRNDRWQFTPSYGLTDWCE